MRRNQTRAAWLSALALAAMLGMAPQQGAAAPIRWRVDPAESGDPDSPGGPGKAQVSQPGRVAIAIEFAVPIGPFNTVTVRLQLPQAIRRAIARCAR